MGRVRVPLVKRCRALGISPAVLGYDKVVKPLGKEVRRKKSEYGMQLAEKQKVKFVYGILERQFRRYYQMAVKRNGVTGEMLLQLLESRLDNVVYRLGFAKTRDAAKQLVSHCHVKVNGKGVNIPSYSVKAGDVISFRERSLKTKGVKEAVALCDGRAVPSWLEADREKLTGKVLTLSARGDIDYPVKEQLIVEYYSK